jgi:hypothetical protein
LGVGADGRHNDEALCLCRFGCPRERKHGIDIDLSEGLLRSGLANRRSEAAQRDLAGEPFQLRLDLLELNDAVRQAGMLAAQRSSGDGENTADIRRIEKGVEREIPHETGRTREQSYL